VLLDTRLGSLDSTLEVIQIIVMIDDALKRILRQHMRTSARPDVVVFPQQIPDVLVFVSV
jgi:nitric oxide reductase large subunit